VNETAAWTGPGEVCRQILDGTATVVVKVGSSLLIDRDGQARTGWMATLAGSLSRRAGPVIVVSSGAIALGRATIGLGCRPASLAAAQAAAAIGQIRLAQIWTEAFARYRRDAAQILLTLGDLEDRARYLNARNTLETLLAHAVVPIINENDTVATGEIRFGDNDRLAARVAQLAGAELLVLLSDVDGLYEANPATHPDARLITTVEEVSAKIEALADGTTATEFGTGGMPSKLAAARTATAAGCQVLLTSGRGDCDPLTRYLDTGRGTVFSAAQRPLVRRKQWLRGLQQHAGRLLIDAGAASALRRGASLLPAGVQTIEGQFERGALLRIAGPDGDIGQGLSGYDADEASCLAGAQSSDIPARLGYAGRGPMIHRDDLVLF